MNTKDFEQKLAELEHRDRVWIVWFVVVMVMWFAGVVVGTWFALHGGGR